MENPILTGIAPKIEGKIQWLLARSRVIGVACGIVFDQKLVWSAGFGFADLATDARRIGGRVPAATAKTALTMCVDFVGI